MGTHLNVKPLQKSHFLSWHAIDLPGHGHNVGATVDDVYNYLESLNEPFHLVGYSMGGRLAQKMASHPQCLSLSLLSSHTLFDKNELVERICFENKLKIDLENLPFEEFLNQFYASPLFSSIKQKKQLFKRYLLQRQYLNKSNLKTALTTLHINQILSPLPCCPTLGLYGAFDLKYTKLYAKMPEHVSIVSVPHSGHVVHFENAPFCIHILEKFIRDTEHELGILRQL